MTIKGEQMSPKKTKTNTKKIATNNPEADAKLIDEVVHWDDLMLAKQEVNEAIIRQQMLIAGLSRTHISTIASNDDLRKVILGLTKSLLDITKDSLVNSLKHSVTTTKFKEITIPKTFKTGKIKSMDDQYLYVNIAAVYMSLQDKVAHLESTAYLDIFSTLKTKDIKKEQDDG